MGNNIVKLPNGMAVPRLGQGTWYMGDDRSREADEIGALQKGIALGLTLIDTAEMYGDGAAERLVGKAIAGYDREKLTLVSKVYPHNAGRKNIFKSCEASLKRLGTEYLDVYLLHWRGSVPLAETAECMNELVASGKIRAWGVSNFDIIDIAEMYATPGGNQLALNQVLYHLSSRGIEYSLVPWMREHNLPVMAYSPMAHSAGLRKRVSSNPTVQEIAASHGFSVLQLMLAFALRYDDFIVVPKAANAEHVAQNAAVLGFEFTKEELDALDEFFPAPFRKLPLDVL